MKLIIPFCILWISLTLLSAHGQGFIYDQQSADDTKTGEVGANLIGDQPVGQSFTPALTAIDFVSLQLVDANWNNGIGATVYVSLFSGALTNGMLLGSTAPIFMPDGFSGNTNFLFPTSITLTPGTTYYLQPILQSGDTGFAVTANVFTYLGGTAYYQGAPTADFDLWFREGIVAVPEPSTAALVLLGGVWLLAGRRRIK
jgi:hypothetical protein